MRYKDQATTVFSEIASIIESSDNAENNIYDIVDFMIGIMTKDQLNQVEDTISHYCDENRVSGQRAWFFVSHLANAYLSQFPEEID